MKQQWTVQELLTWTCEYFAGHGIPAPRLEAEVLLASALGVDRITLYMQYDRPVNEDERAVFREYIKRRSRGEPTAYITNNKEFMSLSFQVDSRVLIPRPDTETLVEEAIRLLRMRTGPHLVADVGTGSGAVAISLAYYVPEARVYAVDIEPGAIEVARANAARNRVEDRVEFTVGNLLEPLLDMKLDLIAANLPYIPSSDLPKLPKEIRDFEPLLALDGGADGLVYYRKLVEQAVSVIKPGGFLLMELGDASQIKELEAGLDRRNWPVSYVVEDLGQRPRVLAVKRGD